MADLAVVTIVRGRGDHLRAQRDLLARRAPDVRHVVVAMGGLEQTRAVLARTPVTTTVVALAADPYRLPLAAARNAGAAATDAELLVFLDVDCLPGPRLLPRYAAAAASHPRSLLCGPVGYLPPRPAAGYPLGDDQLAAMAVASVHRPVPADDAVVAAASDLFWSLSFAVGHRVWDELGGFCERYAGYGAEDTDFAATAGAAGVDLRLVGGAWAWHQDHGPSGPVAAHAGDIVRNAVVFHQRWGRWPMAGWLDRLEADGLLRRDTDGRPELLTSQADSRTGPSSSDA